MPKNDTVNTAENTAAKTAPDVSTAENTDAAENTVTAEPTAEKKVTIKLYRGEGELAQDVFVGVNGKTYLIKRGVEVEVPLAVAEILDNAEKQNNRAITMIEKLVAETGNV